MAKRSFGVLLFVLWVSVGCLWAATKHDAAPPQGTLNAPQPALDHELVQAVGKVLLQELGSEPDGLGQVEELLASAASFLGTPSPPEGLNAWDTQAMTDFERVLFCLEDILSLEAPLLQDFVREALVGIAPTSDKATLEGILRALGTIDTDEIPLLDTALYVNMIQNNMFSESTLKSDIKTSQLRSLMFLMQEADVELSLAGIPMLAMVGSPDGGTVADKDLYPERYTRNLARWTVGEVVTAVEWGEHGAIPGLGAADPFAAFDWVLYKKRYQMQLMGIPLMTFEGMVPMIANFLVQTVAPVGITDPFDAYVQLVGGHGPDTGGQDHRIFALFCPLMRYFWNQGRAADMVGMLTHTGEIASSDYVKLARGEEATFRRDTTGTVIKTVEGPDGYGLLYYTLRGRAPEDGGMMDPVLGITVRLIQALDAAPASAENSGTLFEALMQALEPHLGGLLKADGTVDEAAVDALAASLTPERLGSLIAFLHNHHAQLTRVGSALGEVMQAAHEQELLPALVADLTRSEDLMEALLIPPEGGISVLQRLVNFVEQNRTALAGLLDAGRDLLAGSLGREALVDATFDYLGVILDNFESVAQFSAANLPQAVNTLREMDGKALASLSASLGELLPAFQRAALLPEFASLLKQVDQSDLEVLYGIIHPLTQPQPAGLAGKLLDFTAQNRASLRQAVLSSRELMRCQIEENPLRDTGLDSLLAMLDNIDTITVDIVSLAPVLDTLLAPERQPDLLALVHALGNLADSLHAQALLPELAVWLKNPGLDPLARDARGTYLAVRLLAFSRDNQSSLNTLLSASEHILTDFRGKDPLLGATFTYARTLSANMDELMRYTQIILDFLESQRAGSTARGLPGRASAAEDPATPPGS